MKAIQITFEEPLLSRLDQDDEVREIGRAAVLRRLVRQFLNRKRQADIDAQYRQGYAAFEGLGPEFEGWENMGVWHPCRGKVGFPQLALERKRRKGLRGGLERSM